MASPAPLPAWDPSQYLKFADHRLRPAIDLMNRVDRDAPARVYDLGCGAGNVTRLLARRWPDASIVGIDGSADMLARARESAKDDRVAWQQADLSAWRPDDRADVIYSNAALHWLDNHAELFPRLLGALAPGGVLAVQMPRNHGAPSHTCITDAAAAGPWHQALKTHLRPSPVAEPGRYYDVLAPIAGKLDIWESEYLQVLEGDNPVVEFTKGSALKPLLDALAAEQRAGFLEDYSRRIRAAYAKRADGRTLFPFRRLFIIATAKS